MQVEVDAGLRARPQDAAARERRASDQVVGRLMRGYVAGERVPVAVRDRTCRSGCGTKTDGGIVRWVRLKIAPASCLVWRLGYWELGCRACHPWRGSTGGSGGAARPRCPG